MLILKNSNSFKKVQSYGSGQTPTKHYPEAFIADIRGVPANYLGSYKKIDK